ncbi:TolC family protein [Olivibacter sitiensis]|uniref:TolC family protein n=1 Tax=Olivibacter sitiensis TaxID=376470 RepID=UPI0003F8DD06|nr:TolC family protein [Olivibacter sitiensis]
MRKLYIVGFIYISFTSQLSAQELDLNACYKIARENNLSLKQATSAQKASIYNLQAEKNSFLPKVDLLSSYTYMSRPLTINLQEARDGIVAGSSQQSVEAANAVYREITGSDLSPGVQQGIYNTAANVINTLYPNYNPQLAQQSYFLAGIGVRQPIYLGNKLNAARNLAESTASTATINVDVVQKEIDFLITVQYLRLMYLNTLIEKQENILSAMQNNKRYTDEMVKNDILPPYQRNWVNVALSQAKTNLSSLHLEKQNAIPELNKLLGLALDNDTKVSDTLRYATIGTSSPNNEFWLQNPVFQLANSKTAFAKTSEKISKSFSLPNLFAIGNYNLYQRDLPVTIPDWFVGLELQWTLFNGQTRKRTQAARQLIEEAELAQQNTSQTLQVSLLVANNKMKSLENEVATLDSARKEAYNTTGMVQKRMQNQLSSPKDLNETLLVQNEIEKAYYTAVFGYYLSLAEYYNILGDPKQISAYIP